MSVLPTKQKQNAQTNKMTDQFELKLLEIHKLPGNNECADCGTIGTEWASHNIGIFLCTRCAGIHRGLGVHISKVKNLRLDRWDALQVSRMEEVGNLAAVKKYEAFVPICYRRPRERDPHVLLEQWIRSKYLRNEFIRDENLSYLSGHMEGTLLKKRKWDTKYFPRRFVLSQTDGVISYFVGEKQVPKCVIRLAELNLVLSPEKLGATSSMQLTYLLDGTTRHVYLKHDDGFEIAKWFHGIRAAKLHRLQVAFPAATTSQLLPMLANDFAMEGWVSKTGPRKSDRYRRRWFILDGRKLMYHDMPLDPHPKGEIFLGHMLSGYSVRVGVPPGIKDIGFPFTMRTPARVFHLSCQKEEDRDAWIQAIQDVLSRPLTPQDNALAARLIRKRNQHSLNIFSPR